MTQFPQRHPLGYRFPWNDADCLHPPTVMLSDLLSVGCLAHFSRGDRLTACTRRRPQLCRRVRRRERIRDGRDTARDDIAAPRRQKLTPAAPRRRRQTESGAARTASDRRPPGSAASGVARPSGAGGTARGHTWSRPRCSRSASSPPPTALSSPSTRHAHTRRGSRSRLHRFVQ